MYWQLKWDSKFKLSLDRSNQGLYSAEIIFKFHFLGSEISEQTCVGVVSHPFPHYFFDFLVDFITMKSGIQKCPHLQNKSINIRNHLTGTDVGFYVANGSMKGNHTCLTQVRRLGLLIQYIMYFYWRDCCWRNVNEKLAVATTEHKQA